MSFRACFVDVAWEARFPVFASAEYLRTVSNEYGWIAGVDSNGLRRCVVPFCVLEKVGLRLARFTSDTIFIGKHISIDEERVFLNAVIELLRSRSVDVLVPATFNSLFRTFPDGAVAAPYGSFVCDLTMEEATLWNNIHPKHRNKIRGATKSGVTVRLAPEALATTALLVREAFDRSTTGLIDRIRLRMRRNHDEIVSEAKSLGSRAAVFVAELNGTVQAGAIVPFSDFCAYYSHGGSATHSAVGAMNLLQWEIMKHFQRIGVRAYNFVGARINPQAGSKQEGLANFKRRFGGPLAVGYMWKYSVNPSKAWIYNVGATLRSGGDVVDKEKHKQLRSPAS